MGVCLCDALSWQISLQIQLQEETLEKDQAGLVNTGFTSASASVCSLPGPPTHPELERSHAIRNSSLSFVQIFWLCPCWTIKDLSSKQKYLYPPLLWKCQSWYFPVAGYATVCCAPKTELLINTFIGFHWAFMLLVKDKLKFLFIYLDICISVSAVP